MAYGYPVLLDFTGGNQTRPDKPHKPWLVAELKQVIAEYSRKVCVARHGSRGLKANHLSFVIPAKTGIQWFVVL